MKFVDKSRKFHIRTAIVLRRHAPFAEALCTLRSLVPSQAKWATYFRVFPSDVQHDIHVVGQELIRKAYATSRWKPQLARFFPGCHETRTENPWLVSID